MQWTTAQIMDVVRVHGSAAVIAALDQEDKVRDLIRPRYNRNDEGVLADVIDNIAQLEAAIVSAAERKAEQAEEEERRAQRKAKLDAEKVSPEQLAAEKAERDEDLKAERALKLAIIAIAKMALEAGPAVVGRLLAAAEGKVAAETALLQAQAAEIAAKTALLEKHS